MGGGKQLPPLVLKALGNHSPETSTQYVRHFQWSGHCPFFSAMSYSRKESGALGRLLPRVLTRDRLSWFICGLRQRSRETWGLLPVLYNSSGTAYTRNYSEKAIVVVQIHIQHKSALTFKSGRAFMLYYLCKGDNWCEISRSKKKIKTKRKLGFEQEINLKKQLFYSGGRPELLIHTSGVRTSMMPCSA